jgi:hypothetical protein
MQRFKEEEDDEGGGSDSDYTDGSSSEDEDDSDDASSEDDGEGGEAEGPQAGSRPGSRSGSRARAQSQTGEEMRVRQPVPKKSYAAWRESMNLSPPKPKQQKKSYAAWREAMNLSPAPLPSKKSLVSRALGGDTSGLRERAVSDMIQIDGDLSKLISTPFLPEGGLGARKRRSNASRSRYTIYLYTVHSCYLCFLATKPHTPLPPNSQTSTQPSQYHRNGHSSR